MLTNHKVAGEYVEWRRQILGMRPTGNLKNLADEVYGVLLDVGMGNGRDQFFAISMYAFNTGEASLKSSSGGGVMGLGDNPQLVGIPQKITNLSQMLLHLATPTKDYEYADANRVRFHFITTSGVRVHECGLSELRPSHAFFEIFNMFSRIKYVADRFMDEINRRSNSPR